MRTIAAIVLVLLAASPSEAVVRAMVTPHTLSAAINKADALLVPYRRMKLSPHDIRAVRCIAPDEEPTEFQCKWQQRIRGRWINRTTWLTTDANGWRVMDA